MVVLLVLLASIDSVAAPAASNGGVGAGSPTAIASVFFPKLMHLILCYYYRAAATAKN